MDIFRVNGINKDLSELKLNHEIIIPKNMRIYCSCCNLELIRPNKEMDYYYNNLNNAIRATKSITTNKAPYFYCSECWNKHIEPNLYELINKNHYLNK